MRSTRTRNSGAPRRSRCTATVSPRKVSCSGTLPKADACRQRAAIRMFQCAEAGSCPQLCHRDVGSNLF